MIQTAFKVHLILFVKISLTNLSYVRQILLLEEEKKKAIEIQTHPKTEGSIKTVDENLHYQIILTGEFINGNVNCAGF